MLAPILLFLRGAQALTWYACLSDDDFQSLTTVRTERGVDWEDKCNEMNCAVMGYKYAYYVNGYSYCACGNEDLLWNQIVATDQVLGDRQGIPMYCNEGSMWSVSLTQSEWAFQTCTFGTAYDRTDPNWKVSFTTLPVCFSFCQSAFPATDFGADRTRTVYFDPSNNICFCHRGDPPQMPTGPCWKDPSNSGAVAFSTYYWVAPPATASGARRRREIQQLALQQSVNSGLCPGSLVACRLNFGEDGYECLDIATELESCGGCTHGPVDPAYANTTGVDCLALPGIEPSRVTCSIGQCKVSDCIGGWELVDGQCVEV